MVATHATIAIAILGMAEPIRRALHGTHQIDRATYLCFRKWATMRSQQPTTFGTTHHMGKTPGVVDQAAQHGSAVSKKLSTDALRRMTVAEDGRAWRCSVGEKVGRGLGDA